MKHILMISTGGTIASKESGSGLSPAIFSDEILEHVPCVGDFCRVDTMQLMNLDSTNIGPEHWLQIANVIETRYANYDGFVVTHGTDTMAYTAAALSYLIQNSPKPIVITGSQKPISLEETDARRNLVDSFLYASDDRSHDVSLIFDGKVILGTRARKERTKSYNAFSSVDYPEVAVIRDRRIIRYLSQPSYGEGAQPTFYHALEPNIFLMTLIPGMDPDVLCRVMGDYKAVVFQSFGTGGLPGGGTGKFAQVLKEWIDQGKTVVMMTQVPYEGSDMVVYQIGQQLKTQYKIIETYNMTMEAAVVKLMWVLAQEKEPDKIRDRFYQSVQCDIIH